MCVGGGSRPAPPPAAPVAAPPPPPIIIQAATPAQAGAERVRGGPRGSGGSGAGGASLSPTMLTGPGGIDPAMLTIGRNTLLGGA